MQMRFKIVRDTSAAGLSTFFFEYFISDCLLLGRKDEGGARKEEILTGLFPSVILFLT